MVICPLMMEISLLEKWPNFTNISGKFVINFDVIKMTDDLKKMFTFFKSTLGKDVLCQESAL